MCGGVRRRSVGCRGSVLYFSIVEGETEGMGGLGKGD